MRKGLLSILLSASALFSGCTARANESEQRSKMVAQQIAARGVRDARVLAAMREVPRHEFVPRALRGLAYRDRPLSIGYGQTISQPYIVAAMTELAQIAAGDRVLDIGTGSGYQAAVLAALGAEVYSIEIIPELAAEADERLTRLGYSGVRVRQGDGYAGWPGVAPFDAIVVAAAPPRVPPRLVEQLAAGGRLVIPVGDAYQELQLHTRHEDGIRVESIFPVRFVPMVEGNSNAPQEKSSAPARELDGAADSDPAP